MNAMNSRFLSILTRNIGVVAVFHAVTGICFATSVPVGNFSFEDGVSGPWWSPLPNTSWVDGGTDDYEVLNPGGTHFDDTDVPGGDFVLNLPAASPITQDLVPQIVIDDP